MVTVVTGFSVKKRGPHASSQVKLKKTWGNSFAFKRAFFRKSWMLDWSFLQNVTLEQDVQTEWFGEIRPLVVFPSPNENTKQCLKFWLRIPLESLKNLKIQSSKLHLISTQTSKYFLFAKEWHANHKSFTNIHELISMLSDLIAIKNFSTSPSTTLHNPTQQPTSTIHTICTK